MRSGSTLTAIFLALLLGLPAGAEEALPRIVDVRVGRHPAFDRVVLELEREAPVFRLPVAPGEETLLEVRARPLLPRQEIATGSPRLELLILEETLEGTRIRLRKGEGRVRLFILASPPRLVVDVADAGTDPFEPPPGAQTLPAPPPEFIEAPTEGPAPGAGVPEEPGPVEQQPEEAPPVEPSPEEPVPPGMQPEEPSVAEVTPEEPIPEPIPEVTLQPAPPEPSALPLPPPEAAPEKPAPGKAVRDRWLALLVWVGGPLLVVGLGLYLTRGRRHRPPESAEPRIPESITPGEVLSASDRLDLLEKRIDEEVRARMHLENRVVQVQEDLKVVRDRVSRISPVVKERHDAR
jgi:hypothetical protein